MIENRDYMRSGPDSGSPFRFRWSVSTILMATLIGVYALQCINDVYLKTPAEYYLALTPEGLKSGYLWQLLTFQFLHGNTLHLFGNLLGLYFFGRFVENVLGSQRFLVAYFGAGIVGGIFQGLLMLVFPFHFGGMLYGASAGVSGAFAIFAMLERDSEVRVSFVLPVRALTLLYVYCAISLFFTLVPAPRDHTAHAAHLGGLLAGIAWVKLGWHRDFATLPWENFLMWLRSSRPLKSRERKRELVRAASVKGRTWRESTTEPEPELPAEEFISKEVDPILDKISAHGVQSLTERERKVLEAARKKMGKR